MPPPVVPPSVAGDDRLAAVYQLKIHLVGISPHIVRRVLVRGDTTLAELHHVFQVAMGWENWHLHSFKLWGKEYGIPYSGGIYFADDARRVHLESIKKCGAAGFSSQSAVVPNQKIKHFGYVCANQKWKCPTLFDALLTGQRSGPAESEM